MKNLKKVLAMVLAFACTFTMFAGAKVFEDVPAGSDYSEAITMLSDLGIIQGKDDGKYHPEDTITRAEACAMIARLMTGDPNVSQYTGAQNFADVAKGSWKDSAIGYCYINNIVVGVGNNKFEPDRAITDAEFITMVVRAMGYETPDMTQGYPFSYMSNAQAIGLLDGVNMVASTDALRGEDAQVIYNAMLADYARGAMLVNTTHGSSVEVYPTLAESVWGLTKAAVGEWEKNDSNDETAELTNCKAHTWVVIGADPTEEGHILAYPIDDDTTDLYDSRESHAYDPISFKYEGAGDVESIKGYKVELWGEGSHGEPTWKKGDNKFVYSEDWTIKAIKTVKGQSAYDYNASMADSKSDNGTIELEDTSLDLATAASNASKIKTNPYFVDQYVINNYNNVKVGDDGDLEEALNIRDGAQYKLMDWDGDDEADWVVVSTANYYKIETINSKRATVVSMQTGTGDAFESETKSNSEVWKLDGITTIDGNKYNFTAEGLEEGDIVEVTYSVAYDKGEKAAVATATVSKLDPETKSLDKVSTKGGLTLTFDDEEIKVAQNYNEGDVMVPANPATYREFNSEEFGTDFNLYLNRNGFIVYSDYATEVSNYAMVLDAADGEDRAGDRNLAKVDLLTADNTVLKDVELTSGARVQDAKGDPDTVAYNARKIDETEMVGNVYKYWTNEDGQITRMQAMIGDTKVVNATENADYTYTSKTDRLQDANNDYVASLEEADVIFAVKDFDGQGNSNYIQTNGNTEDYYVDADDVIAVKAADVPDISTTEDTTPAKIDAQSTDSTWLRAANNQYDNTFVISANDNKAGTAVILGVNNFNKFGVTNTKIGLVTDVSYTNSADGKYVELTAAFGGENKTIESAKKVDFGDIVKAYDEQNTTDLDVNSESSAVNNTLFGGKPFDKYLEENAAYAEITTDADGNLTKVVFLDVDNATNANELVGHYYTVSRNVVTENKSKSFTYINNNRNDSYNYYESDSNLYSVDRMPVTNAAVDDETVYYTIDGKPSINEYATGNKKYNNAAMLISDGFDGTPDIEVSDKASMMTSSVRLDYNSDTYFVADIARKNDDIVAMYQYTDDLGEVASANVVSVTTDKTDNKIQAGTGAMTVNLKTVGGQQSSTVTVSPAYLKGDSKETPVSGITVSSSSVTATPSGATFTIQADRTVAAGTYVVELTTSAGTQYLEFTVTAADAIELNSVKFGALTASGEFKPLDKLAADSNQQTFEVQLLDKNGDAMVLPSDAVVNIYEAVTLLPDAKFNATLVEGVYTVDVGHELKDAVKYTVEIGGQRFSAVADRGTSTPADVKVSAVKYAAKNAAGNLTETDQLLYEVEDGKSTMIVGLEGISRALSNAVTDVDASRFTVTVDTVTYSVAEGNLTVTELGDGYYELTLNTDLSTSTSAIKIEVAPALPEDGSASEEAQHANAVQSNDVIEMEATVDTARSVKDFISSFMDGSDDEAGAAKKLAAFGEGVIINEDAFIEAITAMVGGKDTVNVSLVQKNPGLANEYWQNDSRIDTETGIKAGNAMAVSELTARENTKTFIIPKDTTGEIIVEVYTTGDTAEPDGPSAAYKTGVKVGTIKISFDGTQGDNKPME